MQEFKGTKGIWHCDDCGHIEDKDCRPIGGVFINRRLAFEWEANAQLMAAAPEMLNACIDALKYVSCEESAFHILNNAIAKALGE